MNEINRIIKAGLILGFLLGIVHALFFVFKSGIIYGSISGLSFGLTAYLFVISKAIKKQTHNEINDEDVIIYSGGANHFMNMKAVEGKLFLLKDKLQFQSHNCNVQNHNQSIDLNEIKEINFYYKLGLIPNGLTITKNDGEIEKLIVNGSHIWKEEIEKQIMVTKLRQEYLPLQKARTLNTLE